MSRRQEWGALAALVLVSTALRAWAALTVPVPWIAPDEMVYGLLGRSLYEHGTLDVLGGPTPFYSALVPALVGLPLSVFSLDTGYDVLRGVQALVMSLAAVPVYIWARSLVSRRSAFVAAALTLAAPGLTYSGLVMTEVLFYPLFVLAVWAAAEAIARPSRHTHVLLVLAFAATVATRLQAIVLLPAFVTAALVDAALGRSLRNLRRLAPAAGGLAVLMVVWLGWRLSSGSGTLGGYEVVASASYSVGTAAKFVVYHLASVLILCGLFPACAVAVLLVRAARRGEPDPRVRAYLAVTASLTAWVVVEVGVFASRYSDRIVERNLIGLGPVLFVGLVLWLERRPAGTYVERAGVALAAAAVLLVLPVKRYVNVFGTHDAMTLIPFYKLVQASSPGTLLAVYLATAAAAAVAFALLPHRVLRRAPVVLLAALIAASVVSSRFVAQEARAQQHMILGEDPSWVDHAGGKRIAYIYDGEPSWNGVWQTLFWNDHIDRVYDLDDAEVPGPLPQTRVTARGDGKVVIPASGRKRPKFAVVSNWIELRGERRGQVAQQGLKQAGLTLWELDRPLRVLSRVFGLQPNGDIYGPTTGRLVEYECTQGTFLLTLLVKQAETVEIRIDGRIVQHLSFSSPTVWRGRLPVAQHGGAACILDVTPSGLLGTTVFTFERG